MEINEIIMKTGKLYILAVSRAFESKDDLRLRLNIKNHLLNLVKEEDEDLYNFITSLDEKTKKELINDAHNVYLRIYLTDFWY